MPAPRIPRGIRRRVERLQTELRQHDYRYYVLDRPTISDTQYDRMFAELLRLEQQYPALAAPDSPTQRVGGQPLPEFPSVPHVVPMLSLESVTHQEDVQRFDERLRRLLHGRSPEYVLEPKFDGLSLELVYEQGRLTRASTRGDGLRGEGVTENVRTIRTVPLRLHRTKRPIPRLLSVRGEALMPIRAFERLNRQLDRGGKPLFANPRNAAAGSIRQLAPRVTAGRPLEVIFYDVLASEGVRFETGSEALEALRGWGLRVSPERRVGRTVEDVITYRDGLERRRNTLGYEVDGIVLKLNDLRARGRIGVTGRHPRWALAYKFTPRERETIIEDVISQVGRTGVVTPVAVLKPISIGGVTVTRATLHNRAEIARKDLRVGDTVRVARAGDVIPEVVGRVARQRRSRPFVMPRRCPACRAALVREGPIDRCPNAVTCPAQLRGSVRHFGSRAALDIRGLGRETVDELVSSRLVRNVADLFFLREQDLRSLARFGAISAHNLVQAIDKARHTELARFIYALGIPGVGAESARDLADHFRDLSRLVHADEAALRSVSGIGAVTAGQIAGFFRRPASRRMIDACRRGGLVLAPPPKPRAGSLAGRMVVFTGALDRLTRAEAEALVRRAGGRAAASVGARTDLVVAGAAPGSKYERARRLGVTILDEPAFLKLVGPSG